MKPTNKLESQAKKPPQLFTQKVNYTYMYVILINLVGNFSI